MEEKKISVYGTPLSYAEKGVNDKGTILFLHGLCGSKREFTTLIFPYIPDEWRCIALDFPGFGASGLSKTEEHGIHLYAETVKKFLDMLGIGKIYLYGMSMGGSVAFLFAAAYSEHVMKVAVQGAPIYGKDLLRLSAALRAYEKSLSANRALALYSMRCAFDGLKLGVLFHPKFLLRIFTHVANIREFEIVTKEVLEIVRKDFHEASTRAIAEAIASLLEFDIRRTLRTFTVPTLIIDGASAYLKPGLDSIEHIMALLPPDLSRAYSVPEVGHMATIFCPKEVTRVMLDYFSS